MKPTDEIPVIFADRLQSLNYDGPDMGETFADAGTRLDLDTGSITSTGLAVDGVTGDVAVRGEITGTSFVLIDGADSIITWSGTGLFFSDGAFDAGTLEWSTAALTMSRFDDIGEGAEVEVNSFTGAATITAKSDFLATPVVLTVDAAGVFRFDDGAARFEAGSESAPGVSFHADTDTGLWHVGANNLAVVAAGSRVFDVVAGQLRAVDGSVGTPVVSFIADTNTGLYRPGADVLGVAAGGVAALRVEASRFDARGVWFTATASTVDVRALDSTGRLGYFSSSLDTKTDIEPMDLDRALALIDGLQPIWYRSTNEVDRPDWSHYGFAAEHVADLDPRLAGFDENGKPITVAYSSLVVPLVAYVQALAARLAQLESRA